MQGYSVMGEGKHRSRIGAIVFAALSILIIAAAQLMHGNNATGFVPQYYMIYGAPIMMIFAGIFRSYLLFLVSVIYYSLHQMLSLVLLSLKEGAYTSFDGFETFTEYALFFLGAAVVWQTTLFLFGHADHVAITHTVLLFTSLTMILTFMPYMINLFLEGLYITDSYNVFCLGLSYLSFVNGIEKKQQPEA
jgi:hypothetical protein